MKILFERHGKDDDRYRGGWSNLDLVPEGIEEAKLLARYLKKHEVYYGITKIISSDLKRTMTTASFISEALGLPIEQDARVRETNNGDLAGMLNSEALVKYPGLFFNSLGMDEPYPNGESPRAFYERIKLWFENFIDQQRVQDDNVLVVTHGGVINVIYHIVRGMEWNNKTSKMKIQNCSMHVLDVETMTIEEVYENN